MTWAWAALKKRWEVRGVQRVMTNEIGPVSSARVAVSAHFGLPWLNNGFNSTVDLYVADNIPLTVTPVLLAKAIQIAAEEL